MDRSVAARWTPRLGNAWCGISSFFLANYCRLRPHEGARGLNSSEAMVIIHLMDHKWDARAPFPTVSTLATRMGISTRAVRETIRNLETSGYLRRVPMSNGGPNRYQLEPLFSALERLMDEDVAKEAAAKEVA